MILKRLKELRRKMASNKLDAIIISQPENIRYLSNFTGGEGYLFISQERQVAVNHFIYIEQIKEQSPDFDIYQEDPNKGKSEYGWIKELCKNTSIRTIGFEASHLVHKTAFSMLESLNESGLKLVSAPKLTEEIRMIKNKEEVENIQKAAIIADNALANVSANLKEGMAEKEIAWWLEMHMRSNGSETLPFDIIVGSGPNGALPHATPTDRKIRAGEPIVIDMGARFNGYASDITRTLYLGKPDEMFLKIYRTVLKAQLTAISNIKPGMRTSELDNIAREVISKAGYGDNYKHGLGHGVGLNVHETPFIGPKSEAIVKDRTIFTIEPGIYIPGWGGVRIEDTYYLNYGRIKTLTNAEKISY